MNNQQIVSETKQWLIDIVVGHNFCPFAKREVLGDKVHYQVTDADALEQSLMVLQQELQQLQQQPQIATSLIIFNTGFADFEQFLDLVDLANVYVDQGGYRGEFQLAHFHPDYLFEGEDPDDASHFTNRSPYPMLHLLREADLEQALKNYPNPETIPENNIAKARDLGQAYFIHYLQQLSQGNQS